MENPRIAALARWHLLYGLLFGAGGMLLGIHMASSGNHTQHVTHAHMLLLGFVLSVLYAVIYRLWLGQASTPVAVLQTGLHQVGSIGLAAGLFLLYGRIAEPGPLKPLLAAASMAALAGLILALVQVVLAARPRRAGATSAKAAAT